MRNLKQNILSVLALAIFTIAALSSEVNKIHANAFKYNNNIEEPTETNYLVKNDGEKIEGEKISWKMGLLTKNEISIDDQKLKIAEVRGYMQDNVFYGRVGKNYIKRIVRGKVNVYVMFTDVTTTSTNSTGGTFSHSYTRTDHYAQRGDDGPMVPIGGQKDILNFVGDCPAAAEMINISNSQVRKEIKKDPDFLNSVFDVYNNDCAK